MIRQNIIPQQDGHAQELEYPAFFHYRIITDTEVSVEPALTVAIAAYQVTAPLQRSHASTGGRYTAYSVSILMPNRETMEAFDAAARKIPGVRMLL